MSIKQYGALLAICLSSMLLGQFFDDQTGVSWFLWKSTISAAVVLSTFYIPGKTSLCICGLETGFMLITTLATISYITGLFNLFYDYYVQIMYSAVIIELTILTVGGIYGPIRRLSKHSIADIYNAAIRRMRTVICRKDLS